MNVTGKTVFSSLMMVFLSACGPKVTAVGVTEMLSPSTSTRVGLLPMKTAAGGVINVGGGWTYRPIESVQPSLCGQKGLMFTGVYLGPHGEMVPGPAAATAADTTCAKLASPLITGLSMFGSANLISRAITHGADAVASSVDKGLQETSDGLQSVGDGLSDNAAVMSNTLAIANCQSMAAPAALTCLKALFD